MIKNFQLLRNVGQFDSTDHGKNLDLGRLTLIYADNGRGKTTLAAVMRSLATGDPLPIEERKRLSSSNTPHVCVNMSDGTTAVFQNATWNRQLHDLVVFDDVFVEENVYSGLSVSPRQRQNLHDLVLGEKAVALNRKYDELVEEIEVHNRELTNKRNAIPETIRGGLSVDEFCALKPQMKIDEAIQQAQLNLTAAENQEEISRASVFASINLPMFDVDEIRSLLEKDLPSLQSDTLQRLEDHFTLLGEAGEGWVSDGMNRIDSLVGSPKEMLCPFCAQSLSSSDLVQHYEAYFSDAYSDLKGTIKQTLDGINKEHEDGVRLVFERDVSTIKGSHDFWAKFCTIDEIALDTADISRHWTDAWKAVSALLSQKEAAPLEKVQITEAVLDVLKAHSERSSQIAELNLRLKESNKEIEKVKEKISQASVKDLSNELQRLKLTKIRHTPEIDAACKDYIHELNAKAKTEAERDQARADLNQYRESAFPDYQDKVNQYLEQFGAGFRLEMKPENIRRGSTSTYKAQIGNASIEAVRANVEPGQPTFGNIFSSGDRSTLAFAFFLASLESRPNLQDTIVVIDDPISSMDDHRLTTTVQKVRKLSSSAAQVIVLSHNKPFLCRIWEGANGADRMALEIARDRDGSTLREWNVSQDSYSEHDRRHTALREYCDTGNGNIRDIASFIRLYLEGYLRSACPSDFPPGEALGKKFVDRCVQAIGTGNVILDKSRLQELEEILEYAHKFHHETNQAYLSETIVDAELLTFVKRTLAFTKP